MAQTKDQLNDEIVRILRAISSLRPDERERRLMLVRDLAESSVALREHFMTKDGKPDWAGGTHEYRKLIRDLYSAAAFPAEDRAATQGQVRYHVGQIVRRFMSPEELEDAGLLLAAPAERMRDLRAQQSALLSSLAVEGDDGDGPHVEPSEAAKVEALRDALAILTKVKVNKRRAKAMLSAPPGSPEANVMNVAIRLLQALRSKVDDLTAELRSAGAVID